MNTTIALARGSSSSRPGSPVTTATTSCWSRVPPRARTVAAGVAIAEAMRVRERDQLVVVCPTVIMRDQWAAELGRLGNRMRKRLARHHGGWLGSVHGICATYQQVAARPGAYARACRERPTAFVLDEGHHTADHQAWGRAIRARSTRSSATATAARRGGC